MNKPFQWGQSLMSAIILSMLLMLFSLITGCSQRDEAVPETMEMIQQREGVPVTVVAARLDTLEAVELVGGIAQGYNQATLNSAIPGRISSVNIKLGDRITANRSIMTIVPDMAQNFDLASKQYEDAKKNRERVTAIVEQGGASQQVLDKVELGYLAAKEGMEAMRKSQFVLAPFTGVVVALHQNRNDIVGMGTPLVEIATLEKIRVPVNVSDALVHRFSEGQKAVTVVGRDTVTGEVEKVAIAGSSSTLSFTVEIVFPNPGLIIRPGMYLPSRVIVKRKEGVVVLPMDAVISQGVNRYVYIIDNNAAAKVPVEIGIRGGEYYEITSGVQQGDQVVLTGASLLQDGSKVKIVL